MEAQYEGYVEFSVSDYGQLRSLQEWLSEIPGTRVQRTAGAPGAGELGALDVITVLASSSGLIAAIRVIPEFLKARRSSLSVTAKVHGKEFSINASNVKDLMPIIGAW
jgi:hypothetical protein